MPIFPQLSFARSLEEEYLLDCDGSCASGIRCVSLSHGVSRAGRRLPLLEVCVLCARQQTTRLYNELLFCGNATEGGHLLLNPYCNHEGDYDVRCYLDNLERHSFHAIGGPFIAYDPEHYKKVSDCGIEQTLRLVESNWLSRLFTFDYSGIKPGPRRPQWWAYFCRNPRCKLDLLNFVDKVCAEGSPNIVYDVSQDNVLCLKCNQKATKVFSTCLTPNIHLILQDSIAGTFSRCSFCNTLIRFDKYRFPQCCGACHETHLKMSIERLQVCYVCNTFVHHSRRGGCQTFNLNNTKYFLCRNHRVQAFYSIKTLADLKSSTKDLQQM